MSSERERGTWSGGWREAVPFSPRSSEVAFEVLWTRPNIGMLGHKDRTADGRLVLPSPGEVRDQNIKRIGTIRYTDVRPVDFWAERGYDWYAGH